MRRRRDQYPPPFISQNNGLTYCEACNLMRRLLGKYNYYQ